MERSGVSSIITRYSYICVLGKMSKINNHPEKTRKVIGSRSLHASSWGMLCPADTSDFESCGVVKNLALLAEVTTDSAPKIIENILLDFGIKNVDTCFD